MLKQQVEELIPLLDGPGSVMAAYCEVHAFLSSLRTRASHAQQRALTEEVRAKVPLVKCVHAPPQPLFVWPTVKCTPFCPVCTRVQAMRI